jgi:hypothetical protein
LWERGETERIRDRGKGKKDLTSANLSNTKPYIKSFITPFIKRKRGDKKKLYKWR